METKNNNRMESRSKDFAAFLQTANIGKDSRDYLILVGELENWSRRCHDVIGRDWQDGTQDNTIAECVDTIQQRLMHMFADSVFDNAIDSDSIEL